MAKRGRPGKNDPRYLARKEAELARQQQMERERNGINPSGCPEGVNRTNTGMFQARIRLDGKRINLGSFQEPEEAAAAYQNAKKMGFTCAASPKKYAKRGTGLSPSRSRLKPTHVCFHDMCCDRLSLGRSQGAEEEGAAAARDQRALLEHVRAARHERGRRLRRRAAARSSALQRASRRCSARPLADAGRARVAIPRP